MNHEEEEVQHDISKLQEQVHQIFFSQRAKKKNEMEFLKKGMEAKMDGLKEGMKAKMDALKIGMEDMEGLNEGLTKLIQEMIPNGEKIVQ